jgi:predicted ATPase/serine/threonine protein kinase/DNA-binding CsgD family transcriptional regulator
MPDRASNRVGQQLGNYRILRLLGRGGFAEVYLGEHVYLHTYAALKVLQIVLNDEDSNGLMVEAQTLVRLTHPHIVRVLDFAVENGIPFIVMEYAPKGTLRRRHPQGARLPPETILPYVQQVASALQYAHDRRLIHRDVKPENMLLDAQDQVLLSDFGLAMLNPQTVDNSTHKMVASFVGTASYLSPEQLQGKPQPMSDQYALGVVVYEWLCGKRPFNGSPIEIAMQQISMPPPSLREQAQDLSPALEETVLRALAKDPQQRFASMQDFAIAFERACQDAGHSVSTVSTSTGGEKSQYAIKPEPMWKVPTTFTPLIGREQDVVTLCELLKRPEVRLVTLLGTGGIGKTRLSFQVAKEMRTHFVDGVCVVALAPVTEPDLVVPTIAQELGIQEVGGQSIIEPVKVALREKHLLLFLDNFEQVVATAPLIEEILAACPRVKIVVTSRAVLHLRAEYEFPVPPLGLPNLNQLPENKALTEYTAVALFVQRARAVLPTFQLTEANAHTVAEICVRLDGLPLAIELAAARIKLLPPQALLARLAEPLQVLTGGARTLPPRQQTLRSALKWSYDLLEPEEQELFRRLTVFVGGWTLEAVEEVGKLINPEEQSNLSTLDGVASLLDKSLLLQIEPEGEEPRLIMLTTIREYGRECLRDNGETEITQRAHALYYVALVEEAEPHLKGKQQIQWLTRLERDQENLRAALAWLIEHMETELALRFCAALWHFWYLRGYWSEGRRWLEAALGQPQKTAPTLARARALCGAGNLAYYQVDDAAARPLLEESVTLCRFLGDKRELASALGALGVLMQDLGDFEAARPLLEESETLLRTSGSKWELSNLLRKLGQRALQERAPKRAKTLAMEALTLAQELGDNSLIATTFATLTNIAALDDDLAQAIAYNSQCLTLARELGNKYLIAIALQNLGYFAALQGDLSQAASAREGLTIMRELGEKAFIAIALHSVGYVTTLRGNLIKASVLFREGLTLSQEIKNEAEIGWHLFGLALVAVAEGRYWQAAHTLSAVEGRLDINADMLNVERADYQRARQNVRTHLGEKAFEEAWVSGRTMAPEQLLSLEEQASVHKREAEVNHAPAPVYPDGLTAREVEVLRLLAQGWTDSQIAEQLVISPRTVSTHLTSIYRKIQVTSRSAATRYAVEKKLV